MFSQQNFTSFPSQMNYQNPQMSQSFRNYSSMNSLPMGLIQSQYNDNLSCYSSASTASAMSMPMPMQSSHPHNQKQKVFIEELNQIISNCIEGVLPKIAQECADVIFSKISLQLETQEKEINEMKSQLEKLEEIVTRENDICLTENSTPCKRIKTLGKNINDMNQTIKNTNNILEGIRESESKSVTGNIEGLGKIKEKFKILKDTVMKEKKKVEGMNYQVKDRYVDLMGLKHVFSEKLNHVITECKLNGMKNQVEESRRMVSEMGEMVESLSNEITEGNKKAVQNENGAPDRRRKFYF